MTAAEQLAAYVGRLEGFEVVEELAQGDECHTVAFLPLGFYANVGASARLQRINCRAADATACQ